MTIDDRTRSMLALRERFLSTGGAADGFDSVRPGIIASWRRSLMYGLEPERSRPAFEEPAPSEQLIEMTRRVIEPRRHHFADAAASIALTDHNGRLLVRWVEDTAFQRRLDHHDVLPGFSFAETAVGTNSGGMVLETGRASIVVGPEHFFEESVLLTCAGAPIRHPVTRRVIGTLDLTCRVEQTSPLLLAWVTDMATEIEQLLVKALSSREQALLMAYMVESHDARQGVVCLDHQTIVSNATASRMLSPVDQAMLWERAGQGMKSGNVDVESTITLSDGRTALMRTRPVLHGGATVGALVRLRPLQAVPTVSKRLANPSELPDLPGLVGQSSAWTDMRRRLSGLGGRTLVLVGERGTGKSSVGQALLQSEGVDEFVTVDASGLRAIDERSWLSELSSATSGGAKGVLLTHVEHVGESLASSVHAALDDVRERGLRVVATCTSRGAAMESPMLGWFDVEVVVPPLADRSDDIAVLLEELSWRVTGGMRRRRWTSDAVQTVSRASWPGNVAALDSLVRSIIKDSSKDRVTAADIPASVRARASRRQLVGLERVEAQAIIQALEAVDGNKKAAADALGIARSTLYRKVRALGIDLAGSTF